VERRWNFLPATAWFTSKLDLPPECSDRPEEIVFLLRHAQPGPRYGYVIAYTVVPAPQRHRSRAVVNDAFTIDPEP